MKLWDSVQQLSKALRLGPLRYHLCTYLYAVYASRQINGSSSYRLASLVSLLCSSYTTQPNTEWDGLSRLRPGPRPEYLGTFLGRSAAFHVAGSGL